MANGISSNALRIVMVSSLDTVLGQPTKVQLPLPEFSRRARQSKVRAAAMHEIIDESPGCLARCFVEVLEAL